MLKYFDSYSKKYIQQKKIMINKEEELDTMVRNELRNELSSDEEEERQEVTTRSEFRKPIRDPFSDQDDDSDSDIEYQSKVATVLPPKPPKTKTLLQTAQEGIKWDKSEQVEIDILSKLEGEGMKDRKIRELANKYKSLNILYEKQKTMRKNLENTLNQQLKLNDEVRKSSKQKTPKQELSKSIVKNQEKGANWQQNEKKIMEMRLKNQNMKTQLNKAMRVIAREVGENVNIDQILNEENSWKGRQQKIQKLKGRVKQLEEKLQANGVNVSHMSGFTQISQANRSNNGFSATRSSAMLAQNKRKELENLKVQVDGLRNENEVLQGKVKSLTSRKVVLENEMKELKNQFEKKKNILLEKSDHDDKFIALLKNENQKLKKDEKVVTKIIYKQSSEQQEQIRREAQMLRKKVRALEKKLEENETGERKKASDIPPSNVKNKQIVDINQSKKKQLEEEYIKGTKYLKKLSIEDEEQIYTKWKRNKNNNS